MAYSSELDSNAEWWAIRAIELIPIKAQIWYGWEIMQRDYFTWNIAGVVDEEKLYTLLVCSSGRNWLRNWRIMTVFPVPLSPASNTALRCLLTMFNRYWIDTLYSFGIRIFWKLFKDSPAIWACPTKSAHGVQFPRKNKEFFSQQLANEAKR